MNVNFDGLRRQLSQNYNRVVGMLDHSIEDGGLRMYEHEVRDLKEAVDELRTSVLWIQCLMHDCPNPEDSYSDIEVPLRVFCNDEEQL